MSDGKQGQPPAFQVPSGQSHGFQIPQPRFMAVGAWLHGMEPREMRARADVDSLPDSAERLAAAQPANRPGAGDAARDWDARHCDAELARILDLGLTDIIISVNHGPHGDSAFRVFHELSADSWRTLRYFVDRITQHRYPDGFPWSPSAHIMLFCNTDDRVITDVSAAAIDACAHVPLISSVMLDCEEWWTGHGQPTRDAAARRLRTQLLDAWPRAQRPPQGIGVTGLASTPPGELVRILDYAVPQEYSYYLGDTAASARNLARDYYRRWFDAFDPDGPPAAARRIVVGYAAFDSNAGHHFGAARMRMLLEAALQIGSSGTPPLNDPDTIFYWSTSQILASAAIANEVRREANLARNGGITLANANP